MFLLPATCRNRQFFVAKMSRRAYIGAVGAQTAYIERAAARGRMAFDLAWTFDGDFDQSDADIITLMPQSLLELDSE